MERDFMGLNSKAEAIEAAAFSKSSEVQCQWSLSSFENRLQKDIGQGSSSGARVSMDASHDASRASVQLTIFYGGMVNVYDDMPPEKAQAIMLLAGNGAREATPRTPAGDGVQVSQPVHTALSSPLSVGPSASTGSAAAMDAPKEINSLRRMMQSAVPQMRGASLARFLHKRKERVMASAPYNLGKSSLDSSDKPGSSDAPRKDEKK